MTMREVAEMRVANGTYAGFTVDDVVKVVRERVARGTVSHVTSRLGDGRIVSVSMHPRAGGGWVATHTTSPSARSSTPGWSSRTGCSRSRRRS